MINNPAVSIIIPVYNTEKYLRECLDSVVNQTLKNIEIICVNDGSTDSSPQILQEYAKNDIRIKIISKPNSGYGHTMNVGLDNACGEYIGIVESDDFVNPEMYETLYYKAKQLDVDFIKADFYRFSSDNGKMNLCYNSIARNNKRYYNKILNPQEDIELFKFIMNTWSGIYKRKFIERYSIRHNETPGASYQDNGFWFQTFCRASRVYFINQPLYMNRRDNPNSSVKDKGKVYCMCDEYAFIKKFLNLNPELKSRFIHIYSLKKFHNYIFTYNRIAEEFKKEFLIRFGVEFKEAFNDGELNRSVFSENEWKTLRKIMDNPSAYYYEKNNFPLSFKINQIITNLPRNSRAFFRCWRDYGLKHTIHATTNEIKKFSK